MQCPFCFKETSQGAFCIECGRSLVQQPVAPTYPPLPPTYQQPIQPAYYAEPPKSDRTKLVIAILLVALVTGGVGGGVGYYIKVQNEKAEAAALAAAEAAAYQAELDAIEAERNDYSWVPEGYEKFDVNYNMAYKKGSFDDCWDICFPMRVVSKYYCSSVYIAADVETQGGSFLETTSDYASDLSPGYYVTLEMETNYSDSRVDFTDARCS